MIRPGPTGISGTWPSRDGVVQFKAVSDRSGCVFRPLLGGNYDYGRLVWSWQFQVGELAVEQLGLEEMTVPACQPLRGHISVDAKERDLRRRPAFEQHRTVVPLQRGAREQGRLVHSDPAVKAPGDRAQPGHSVVVGKRLASGHFGDVPGRVQQVTIGEWPVEPSTKQLAHSRLPAP
jgi:hypothetical protein